MPVGTTNTIIAGSGVHHIAVQARDWEESLKLYRAVLGMPIVAEFGSPERKVVLLDIGDGSHIELFQPTASTPAPGSAAPNDPITHLALATTDTRAATEHVRAAGYEITTEPKDVQLGPIAATISFFKGPNGESIEFFQVH
ncbi:MAG TPA: VOC family protein [Roseiflexaceae bacterium]|nr:VOC family protein [Roseiflexaceae bacterium]